MLGPGAGTGVGAGSLTPTLAPADGLMPHLVGEHLLNAC